MSFFISSSERCCFATPAKRSKQPRRSKREQGPKRYITSGHPSSQLFTERMPALPHSPTFVREVIDDVGLRLERVTGSEWTVNVRLRMRNHLMKIDESSRTVLISETAIRRLLPHRSYRKRTTVDPLLMTREGLISTVLHEVIKRYDSLPPDSVHHWLCGRCTKSFSLPGNDWVFRTCEQCGTHMPKGLYVYVGSTGSA